MKFNATQAKTAAQRLIAAAQTVKKSVQGSAAARDAFRAELQNIAKSMSGLRESEADEAYRLIADSLKSRRRLTKGSVEVMLQDFDELMAFMNEILSSQGG